MLSSEIIAKAQSTQERLAKLNAKTAKAKAENEAAQQVLLQSIDNEIKRMREVLIFNEHCICQKKIELSSMNGQIENLEAVLFSAKQKACDKIKQLKIQETQHKNVLQKQRQLKTPIAIEQTRSLIEQNHSSWFSPLWTLSSLIFPSPLEHAQSEVITTRIAARKTQSILTSLNKTIYNLEADSPIYYESRDTLERQLDQLELKKITLEETVEQLKRGQYVAYIVNPLAKVTSQPIGSDELPIPPRKFSFRE